MPMLPSVVPNPVVIEVMVSVGAEPAMEPVTRAAISSAAKASRRVRSTSTTIVAMPTTRASSSWMSMCSSCVTAFTVSGTTCAMQAVRTP